MTNKKTKAIGTAAAQVGLMTAPTLLGGDAKVALATAIASVLSVAVEGFSDLSQRRAGELFDSADFTSRVVTEISHSDDFASLVFDLWRRYSYESSEKRRKMLKSILNRAAYEEVRNYENFSKIILTAQQITSIELAVLDAFYMADTFRYAQSSSMNPDDFQINVQELHTSITDRKLNTDLLPELAQALTQLGNYGLICERPATMGGPYYTPLRFGKVFVEYIQS